MTNPFLTQTKNYRVELTGDLLMVKNSAGDLLKAVVVPAALAVEKFNAMVQRVKEVELKSGK